MSQHHVARIHLHQHIQLETPMFLWLSLCHQMVMKLLTTHSVILPTKCQYIIKDSFSKDGVMTHTLIRFGWGFQ